MTNSRNPIVNVRAMTDDTDLATRLLPEVVRGMQENGLAACAKHFPGDGVDYRDQHMVPTCNSLSMEQWHQQHGKVFARMIEAGVLSIMPGHISLPAYQKERHPCGLPLPATLSHELTDNLLKREMGFQGVVVTDALGMGGFLGWYESKQRSEIESFKAGCDMMLWPSEQYVDNMIQAVENGYISMERLDDAVERILNMKQRLGLFQKSNAPRPLTEQEQIYVSSVQTKTAQASVTLIRDRAQLFPLSPDKTKNVLLVPVCQHEPTYRQAEHLRDVLEAQGFSVTYRPEGATPEEQEGADLVLYALFSRGHRPIGFLDYLGQEAVKIRRAQMVPADKLVVVSFGSPYFGNQYFQRAGTYVNAYSMLESSVDAFVRAAVGQIEFGTFSPFAL